MEKKQIAIVGAGVSGLLACKYLLLKGFHPIVFEARSDIGGAWIKTVETTKLQTPKQLYQFSDYPWPDSVTTDFPDHNQVLDYIQSYASHFDLRKHIKFNRKVVGIEFEGLSGEDEKSWSFWNGNGQPFGSRGKWTVAVEDAKNHSTEVCAIGV